MKKIVFTLLSLVLCNLLFAQHLDQYPTKEHTLLWKIEGKKIKKDSYVFGTIHLIDREQFDFPESLRKTVQSSEIVVMELGAGAEMEAIKYMFLPKGNVLDFFTADQQDSVLNWASTTLGIEKANFTLQLGKMKPFVLSQMGQQMGLMDKVESFDLTIQKIATDNQIPVFGLETVKEQMAIFDHLDTLEQRQMVMEIIRNPSDGFSEMQELFDSYLQKNVDKMHEYIHSDDSAIGKHKDVFLDERNKNWIPKIEKIIKKQAAFIAVGAGHLGGPNGVLRLLEAKGYHLKPIYLN